MALAPEHLAKLVEHWQDWPESLRTIADYVESQLMRTSAETARERSREIAATISYYCGGQEIYFPTLASVESLIRRATIADQPEDRAVNDIAREHRVSARTVRRAREKV